MLSDQTGKKPSKSKCKKVPSSLKSTKPKKTVVLKPKKKTNDPKHVKHKESKEDRDIVRKSVPLPRLETSANREKQDNQENQVKLNIQEVETCKEEIALEEVYPIKTRRKLSLSQLRSLIKMPNLPEREGLKMIDFLQEFALLLLTRKTCKI
jgi:hypothetical protein